MPFCPPSDPALLFTILLLLSLILAANLTHIFMLIWSKRQEEKPLLFPELEPLPIPERLIVTKKHGDKPRA